MAQPEISIEKIQHLLEDADAHRFNFNKPVQDLSVGKAIVSALLLIAQELDQISDCLAVLAKLKQPDEAEIT